MEEIIKALQDVFAPGTEVTEETAPQMVKALAGSVKTLTEQNERLRAALKSVL